MTFSALGGTFVFFAYSQKGMFLKAPETSIHFGKWKLFHLSSLVILYIYKVTTSRFSFTLKNLKELNSAHLECKHRNIYRMCHNETLSIFCKGLHSMCLVTGINSSELNKCLFGASSLPGSEPDRRSGIWKILGCGWCLQGAHNLEGKRVIPQQVSPGSLRQKLYVHSGRRLATKTIHWTVWKVLQDSWEILVAGPLCLWLFVGL